MARSSHTFEQRLAALGAEGDEDFSSLLIPLPPLEPVKGISEEDRKEIDKEIERLLKARERNRRWRERQAPEQREKRLAYLRAYGKKWRERRKALKAARPHESF